MGIRERFESEHSTTNVFDSYIVSTERLVTVRFEAYLVDKHGLDGLIHLNVWRTRLLDEAVCVRVRHLFMAQEGEFVERLDWPENKHVASARGQGWIEIMEYRQLPEETEKYDIWRVCLTPQELDFLCKRFAHVD